LGVVFPEGVPVDAGEALPDGFPVVVGGFVVGGLGVWVEGAQVCDGVSGFGVFGEVFAALGG
jgi:hypothetical protein